MKKLIALLLLSALAVPSAFAGDKSGLSLKNLEKGLQSAGRGISKGAHQSGIEGALHRAGSGVKNAAKDLSHKIDKGAHKAKHGK